MRSDLGRTQWTPQTVPTARDLRTIDIGLTKCLNGDDGGTWAPASPVIIGGSGCYLANNAQITGGVTTRSGGRMVLAQSDYPRFSASRTRTVTIPLMPGTPSPTDYDIDPVYGCIRTLSLSASTPFFIALPQLRMHNAVLLTGATLTWRVTKPHTFAPSTRPRFGVYRVDITNLSAPAVWLLTTSYVSAGNNATAATYYANGNAQTVAYAPDQNNVINTAQYAYFAAWIEESGLSAPPLNLLHSVTLSFGSIANQQPA